MKEPATNYVVNYVQKQISKVLQTSECFNKNTQV